MHKSKKIPTHKIPENLQETFFLRSFSKNEQLFVIDYAHRDDYYLFSFAKEGEVKMLVDFEVYEIRRNTILCILPGQVHFPISQSNVSGWVLAVDPILVKSEFKEIFDKTSFLSRKSVLNEDTINDLQLCISLIKNRLKYEKQGTGQVILHDLVSSYVGMIAEIYQREFPILKSNRFISITAQFKSLLSENYQTLKRPSHYASRLNLSGIYLNEAVKSTTGYSVSKCILNEIIIQAKRLLFYTDLNVKEIAINLGYEDWAYFTRIFTKATKCSPSQFRNKYHK